MEVLPVPVRAKENLAVESCLHKCNMHHKGGILAKASVLGI
jgi:hypothetical protein